MSAPEAMRGMWEGEAALAAAAAPAAAGAVVVATQGAGGGPPGMPPLEAAQQGPAPVRCSLMSAARPQQGAVVKLVDASATQARDAHALQQRMQRAGPDGCEGAGALMAMAG
eukprot:CAMPEP_0202384256 /NCGR_PEP_ID=MMETSP1127-20130417/54331_1 /ASSEMBLY_ACC=CAM_ASM_000462 /TAXON_ID=3047 /ORGANISM="Dunaliella tertiolecta, Strain CCMP1320" /LENGTH=111 /DNA_ID=CAMNT_0048984023 /DNA_START=109 /DNA_END=442 /DNA_ORIENTATION=-